MMSAKIPVYVAGKFFEAKKIHREIEKLRTLGYNTTHDWTRFENVKAPARTPELQRKFAEFDIEAVKAAKFLIVDMTDPEYPYRGTWTEIGCAYGLGKRVHIIGPGSTNCFYHHSLATHHKTWEDFYRFLEQFEKICESEELP
jgi:nucleoside 2-deoxyribosyltransferase